MESRVKDFKEIFAEPRQIALYQDPKRGHVFVATYWGERDAILHAGDIRISQPLDVRFDQLPKDELVQTAIAALDAAEQTVRCEMQQRIDEIRERKQQLLALTYEPDVA